MKVSEFIEDLKLFDQDSEIIFKTDLDKTLLLGYNIDNFFDPAILDEDSNGTLITLYEDENDL